MAHAHTALLNLYYPDMTVPITELVGAWAQGFVDNMAILDASVTNAALAAWVGSANITTLGTIATGTWSATKIAVAKGGTNLSTIAAGSVLVANTLDTITALTSTTGTKILTNTAGTISWELSSGYALSNITLTAGVGLSGGGDLSANRTFTFDATELEAITWGGGAQASIVHTFNVSGTDTTMTYGNGIITASCPLNATTGFQIGGVAATGTILRGNGTNFVATTATYPTTTTAYKLLVSTATSVIGELDVGGAGKLLMGATGAVPIWTTPTYPNSATAGKILVGDGTNIVLSTPTFPNASATSGKFIISDGTNWVASTPTISTTTTAGKILIGDGTNWVSSTPKYPNASATAGKVIRSDGTDFAASTFTIPDTMAINTLLYASAANVISALATGNSGVLVTGVGGIPSISTTLPNGLTFGTLAVNWDIGDTIHLVTDTVMARDAAGLELFEDGGKGITIADSTGDISVTSGTYLTGTNTDGSDGLPSPYGKVTFGVVTSGNALIINDIAGARWAFSTGNYDFTLWKHRTTDSKYYTAAIFQGDSATNYPQGLSLYVGTTETFVFNSSGITMTGGLSIYGGIAANNDISIYGTSHATKTTSYVLLQPTGGYVGIGTTTPATIFQCNGDITVGGASAVKNIVVGDTTTQLQVTGSNSPDDAARFVLHGSARATLPGNIYFTMGNATGTQTVSFESDEGATINQIMLYESTGNVLLGGTSSGTGSPVRTFSIKAGTHPTAPAADSASFFVEDVTPGNAEMRVMDEAGNETTLSPHNFTLFKPDKSYEFPWSYYSKNRFIGKEINVDMYGAIEAIEKLTGRQFIYINDLPQEERRSWDENEDERKNNRQKEIDQIQDNINYLKDRLAEIEKSTEPDIVYSKESLNRDLNKQIIPCEYVLRKAPKWLEDRLWIMK